MNEILLTKFVTSHKIATHPMGRAQLEEKKSYFSVLAYFVSKHKRNAGYTSVRLMQYREMLIGNADTIKLTDENCDDIICSVINKSNKPWTLEPQIFLMCDVALITEDRDAIIETQENMRKFLSEMEYESLSTFIDVFFEEDEIPEKLFFLADLISQFRTNLKFSLQPPMRVLVTANVSAGKSTLINALIGKSVVPTSQETCTANLSYIFDKPFEDDSIHLLNSQLWLNASSQDLMNTEKEKISYIAAYFRKLTSATNRICLIDSPGVNSAIYKEHGELTRKALLTEKYDKLIYVLNASQLGTDEELRHLKYISKNVPKEKVVFVVNKLDNFKRRDDSIETSIQDIRNDLHPLGYENPIICPLSAYCSFLVKMKQNGEILTEDEEDDYSLYVKKYSKAEHDLSSYYGDIVLPVVSVDDKLLTLATKCGLYGLENILYGGMV